MGLFDRLSRALDDALLLTEELREAIDAARASLDAGRPDEALERIEPVLAERPDQPQALLLAGLARHALGDLAGARRDLDAAFDRAPDDPAVSMAKGDLEMSDGDAAAAAESYRAAALRLVRAGGVPFAAAAKALAAAWTRLGRHDRAARELRKAAAAAPDAQVLTSLGRALLLDGETAAASRALRRAMELEAAPEDLGEIGRSLLEARDFDSAEAALRVAAAAQPADRGVRAGLAEALLAVGDLEGAHAEAEASGEWSILADVARARGDVRLEIEARTKAGDDRGALEAAIRADDPALADLAAKVRASSPSEPFLATAEAILSASTDDPERALEVAATLSGPGADRIAERAAKALASPAEGDTWATLDRLARHAAARGWSALAREADRLVGERDRPLRLAVMGEFNAGKSTFINAWIGEEVAPMGVTPTTATLNLLGYGPEKRVRVHLTDDTTREGGYEDLRALLAQAAKEGPERVRFVEILFPAEELLRAQIIDTPGLNAPIESHERTALRALDEADAIVFLFRAGQAGKETERAALTKMRARGRRVLGVVNHADRVAPEELPGIVARLRDELGDAIDDVVCVSARQALEAKGDAALLEKSAFAAVRAAIEERFFVPARAIKRDSAALRANEAIAVAREAATAKETELAAVVRDLEARRARAGEAKRRAMEVVRHAQGTVADGLSQGARAAAAEVATFLAPRRRFWEVGKVAAEDLEFLSDLMDDQLREIARACEVRLGEELRAALADLDPPSDPARAVEGALRGAVLLARGLRRGGRLERALLETAERESPEALIQRLRLVTDGVLEEADLTLTALATRLLAEADTALARRIEDATAGARRHRVMEIAVLDAFGAAVSAVE